MNLFNDLKKQMKFYEKYCHTIFFDKEEKGIFSRLYLPIGIAIIIVIGFILLFYYGIKMAWWFFALAMLIYSEKVGHKEGYKNGYETGWEDGWNRAKGKQISLEYNVAKAMDKEQQ